jgi:hypothetical protein
VDRHRLRACGNGVVPLAAAHAWRTLLGRLLKLAREQPGTPPGAA